MEEQNTQNEQNIQDPRPQMPELEKNTYRNVVGSTAVNNKNNIIISILAAIVGTIPGFLFWLVLGDIGYIAGIAGFVILLGSLFCYGKMQGNTDKFGVAVCVIITCIVIFAADYVQYGIQLYRALIKDGYEVDFFTALRLVPTLLKEDGDYMMYFIRDLFVGYFLTLISCVHILKGGISRII